MKRRWTPADVAGVVDRLSQGSVCGSTIASVRRSKFGNRKTQGPDGVVYDSKLEARFAETLLMELKAHTVLWFTRQVPFILPGNIRYRADFQVVRPYMTLSGDFNALRPPVYVEVIDCKGAMTRTSLNKLKQVKALYGVTVLLYRRDGSLQPFDRS